MKYLFKIFQELNQRFLSRPFNTHKAGNDYFIEQSLLWFRNSQRNNGEFASKYSMLWDKYFSASPEAEAGWIITLIHLKEKYPDLYKKIMKHDVEASLAERIISFQRPDGSFPLSFEDLHNQPPGIFATGQVISGLMEYYKQYRDKTIIEKVLLSANWLLRMQLSNGQWMHYTFHAPHASTMTSMTLIRLGNLVGENKFVDAGKRNIEYTLKLQMKNGYFPVQDSHKVNHFSETIAFTLLGIVIAGEELNNQSYIDAAAHGYQAILTLLKNDGYLPGEIDENLHTVVNYCCLSGNCLMSRAGYRLYKITGDEIYKSAAGELLTYVKQKQLRSRYRYLNGGITGSWPISGQFNTYEIYSSAVQYFVDALLVQSD
jgi:hypothetical protein